MLRLFYTVHLYVASTSIQCRHFLSSKQPFCPVALFFFITYFLCWKHSTKLICTICHSRYRWELYWYGTKGKGCVRMVCVIACCQRSPSPWWMTCGWGLTSAVHDDMRGGHNQGNRTAFVWIENADRSWRAISSSILAQSLIKCFWTAVREDGNP